MLEPKHIPTTGRKVKFQLKQLEFPSLETFAASLPKGAVVADVGAGLSRLGHEVGALRSDITWINIDPAYAFPSIHQAASKNLPSNVSLCAGDIVKGFTLSEELRNGADLVYSYWLLPHLSLEDDSVASAACEHMLDLLKPTGKLAIGPVRHWGLALLPPFRYSGTVWHDKTEEREAVITDCLAKTKLWWLARLVQLFTNRYQLHLGAYFVGGRTKK